MLLAEALLLLLLDEEQGHEPRWVTAADQGLAGALLLDLASRSATAGSSSARAPR